jgi:hypothetical protein
MARWWREDTTTAARQTVPAGLIEVTAIAAGKLHRRCSPFRSAPTIVTQPVSQTINERQRRNITVKASGFR